jgi:hypothetical protein
VGSASRSASTDHGAIGAHEPPAPRYRAIHDTVSLFRVTRPARHELNQNLVGLGERSTTRITHRIAGETNAPTARQLEDKCRVEPHARTRRANN